MSAISLKKVKKYYGQTAVVHGIDLAIDPGEFVVLLGPSGCGKSTTLRMVAGLEDLSGGELHIGNRLMNNVAPRERGVAMVFQNYALYPHMSVHQNMAFALRPLKLSTPEVENRIRETSTILGLDQLLDRRPAQLSGGQRQRVAMGRAMVRTPDVFLFDEPLSNLDAKLRTQVRWEIAKLHQRLGTTVLYVTHDQVEAMTLADKVVIMRNGLIEQVGSPESVYAAPSSLFVATFIGSPSMNTLRGHRKGSRLVCLGGLSVALSERYLETSVDGQALTLGVRPGALDLDSHRSPGAIELRVGVTEFLGDEALVTLGNDDIELVALVDAAARPCVGDSVLVRLDPEKIHVFDSESGLSLIAGDS